MEKKLWPRLLLLGFLLVTATAYLLPSVISKESLPTWFTRNFNKQILKGLDLAGGVYLEYHVELDEAIRLMARHQLGKTLDDADVRAILAFLGSLTGEIDRSLVAQPRLPASGPDTPAPDPS